MLHLTGVKAVNPKYETLGNLSVTLDDIKHFGIREHAMGAILHGLSLSKIRPFGSGFLIFSDYSRASIRLSALMEIPVIHIFTHDSIGVGEDGPTHQPEEYRDSVLPPHVKARVAVEQASTFGWERYVGLEGRIIGMKTFGASAPLNELQKKFGFEPHRVVAAAKQLLGERRL